ncbi:MAG: hypothetical protein ACJ8BW_18500 [Ktedonobacteraceae bacterium]|jgi:hypothetical protein
MNHINYKEALVMLHEAGLSRAEIRRLQRFYRHYVANAMDQVPPDLHHLEFVRWLVATHRLTDQIDQSSNAL